MNKEEKMKELKVFAARIRLETLKIIASFGRGHVGGSLSLADALAVLYGSVMKIDPVRPRWEERDWCVLSKGHAGPALYAALGLKGYFPNEKAYNLNWENTDFPSHADRNKTIGVDLTTGSLGQGFSEAAGVALGNRLKKIDSRVFVFVGDGEADEGEIWEAAQFAAHYHLDHLIALVDCNGRQLDGSCDEVMSHPLGLGVKFAAFGWRVLEVEDGNDVEQIYDALAEACRYDGRPTALILHTLKGKGISFAEESGAHSSTLTPAQWQAAIAESEERLAEVCRREGL